MATILKFPTIKFEDFHNDAVIAVSITITNTEKEVIFEPTSYNINGKELKKLLKLIHSENLKNSDRIISIKYSTNLETADDILNDIIVEHS